jgi:hypothetical protein
VIHPPFENGLYGIATEPVSALHGIATSPLIVTRWGHRHRASEKPGSGHSKRARHREIARRYKRARPAFSMPALRCAEINRLLVSRYGPTLPDDDAGRDDARIMAHHLARLSGDPAQRVGKWLIEHAPWQSVTERTTMIDDVTAKPRKWRADKLAARLGLQDEERTRLRIKTIGATDVTKVERTKRRKDAAKQSKAAARRATGAQPRAEYEAASIARAQPWIIIGISRRTWYRRSQQTANRDGTSPGTI